ncbi:hypothetical protein [Flavobacterium piscisymbiosum]|uniref:Uncharacterized protein n=1 Tax=Flavobacterium piscisymbiosum TaxID=2893753 RepID=A0ABS8M9B6_9FLAO|nr:hypothetical protein [Flavobacterium sp. F-30]MCC9062095.1 hypothetical protein [Flavobacterium sp. F-30]
MKKHLKYIISLFLAFVVIASDGNLVSQSKSADYYQSSYVILKTELDFKNARLYTFSQFVSRIKVSFLIPVKFLEFAVVFSLKIQVFQKTRALLHQRINSFIKQSVFVNEIVISNNYRKSLYNI